jgi:hypothetical protein
MKRALFVLAAILLTSFGATAQTTNGLSDAEIKGQQLAQEILEQRPADDVTNVGVLQIRGAKGQSTQTHFRFTIVAKGLDSMGWSAFYQTDLTNTDALSIVHPPDLGPNAYYFIIGSTEKLKVDNIMSPFAHSDFWIADLGLEFFHWPQQKVLKHESRRTRECTVLESTNPNPFSGSYSKVLSWIDDESLAPVHAEAYDANGKLLKIFDPKHVKKVNGQWQLEDMEIQNVQTGSRTWIKFDLNSN